MKRRDVLIMGSTGFIALKAAGCSEDDNGPMGPDSLTEGISTKTLGGTDLKVSQFGFGSHVKGQNADDVLEREYTMKTAYEKGVRVWDIYDNKEFTGQYTPVSNYLADVKYEVVFSIRFDDYGYTVDDWMDKVLQAFDRDYIDMVRHQVYDSSNDKWKYWDDLFRLKDEGKIKAVGIPVHDPSELDYVIDELPLDFVLFPFNFYHNIGWPPDVAPGAFEPLAQKLKDRGIGTTVMKPFAGDALIRTFLELAKEINPDISFTQAALRYILNSGLEPDIIFAAHNHLREFDENLKAFENPAITEEERQLLDSVKELAPLAEKAALPPHYRFLGKWAPQTQLT